MPILQQSNFNSDLCTVFHHQYNFDDYFSHSPLQHRQACIVFTDGTANDAAKVPAASKAWQEKGVTVFALGIGKGIDAAGKSTGFSPVHLDFHRRQTKMTAEISWTIKHLESFNSTYTLFTSKGST